MYAQRPTGVVRPSGRCWHARLDNHRVRMVRRRVSGISVDLIIYISVLAMNKVLEAYSQWSGTVDVHLFIVCARIYED